MHGTKGQLRRCKARATQLQAAGEASAWQAAAGEEGAGKGTGGTASTGVNNAAGGSECAEPDGHVPSCETGQKTQEIKSASVMGPRNFCPQVR